MITFDRLANLYIYRMLFEIIEKFPIARENIIVFQRNLELRYSIFI